MSTASNQTSSVSGKTGNAKGAGTAEKKARQRVEYQHEMTGPEKAALAAVRQAKNVCTQLAISIQAGETVNSAAINACLDLQKLGMDMLFAVD